MHAQRISQCVLAALITAATAVPTVHLAGDSTMVATGGGEGTQGWGLYLPEFITLNVINYAAGGRSARSFTRERRFAAMAANVKPGDFVVAEFSHNDAESLDPANDGGRAPCDPGKTNNYAAVCHSFFNHTNENVLTFHAYLVNAAKLFQAQGATVIISSATPNNVWEGGKYAWAPNRFTTFSRDAAAAAGATFVDHGYYTAALYEKLGSAVVNSYYPKDHTHTAPEGAKTVARAFITALEATGSTLKRYVKPL